MTSQRVKGVLKLPGKTRTVDIPVESISSVQVADTLFDKLRTGKTVKVLIHSKPIRVHCVHNAKEFPEAITVQVKQTGAIDAVSSDYIEELEKLKGLLTSGVITEEEFSKKTNPWFVTIRYVKKTVSLCGGNT